MTTPASEAGAPRPRPLSQWEPSPCDGAGPWGACAPALGASGRGGAPGSLRDAAGSWAAGRTPPALGLSRNTVVYRRCLTPLPFPRSSCRRSETNADPEKTPRRIRGSGGSRSAAEALRHGDAGDASPGAEGASRGRRGPRVGGGSCRGGTACSDAAGVPSADSGRESTKGHTEVGKRKTAVRLPTSKSRRRRNKELPKEMRSWNKRQRSRWPRASGTSCLGPHPRAPFTSTSEVQRGQQR